MTKLNVIRAAARREDVAVGARPRRDHGLVCVWTCDPRLDGRCAVGATRRPDNLSPLNLSFSETVDRLPRPFPSPLDGDPHERRPQ
jgi:hypothetical protein